MLATPTTSSTSNRPFQFQPPLTPIFSSPPPPPPPSTTAIHHSYVPLVPSPLSPRSVRRKGSKVVGTQRQQEQQQQWRNLRYQSMSSPTRKPLQEEMKRDFYDERPPVDVRFGSGNCSRNYARNEGFGPGSGSGSGSESGFGVSSSSLATNFLPSPSPSPSPLSSPLSQSPSASLFSWKMDTGRIASAMESGDDGAASGGNSDYATAPAAAVARPQQRVHRPNPLLRSRDAVAKRRRDLFLNKVRLGRDECRWGDRGDQILRLDFVADKKRWEAELARTAPEVPPEAEYEYNDEMDTCRQGGDVSRLLRSGLQQQPNLQYHDRYESSESSSNNPNNTHHRFNPLPRHPTREEQEREEAELIAQRENQELEALVALMEDSEQQAPQPGPPHRESPFKNDVNIGDDEEDLDGLLMGYATSKDLGKAAATMMMVGLPPSQQQPPPPPPPSSAIVMQGQDQNQNLSQHQIYGEDNDDQMDMSLG